MMLLLLLHGSIALEWPGVEVSIATPVEWTPDQMSTYSDYRSTCVM